MTLIKDLDYFLNRTIRVGDCLEWTKSLNSDGYPRVVINGYENGKGHREVFFLVNGYYPPVVRHTCDNIKCINPEHLIAGTHLDNVQDRVERGRTYNHKSSELKNEVMRLREQGLTYKQIGEALELSYKTVDSIIYNQRKKFRKAG